jgi:hypothetical protein
MLNLVIQPIQLAKIRFCTDRTEKMALEAVDQVKLAIITVENQIDGLRNRKPFLLLGKQLLGVIFLVVFIWSVLKICL